METTPVRDITGARVLALLGDSITTGSHLAGRLDQEGQPGRQVSDRPRRRSRRTSTRTARAAATTK